MKKLTVIHNHSTKPRPQDILRSFITTNPNASEAEVEAFGRSVCARSEDVRRAIFDDVFNNWVKAGGLNGPDAPTLGKMMKWVKSENRKAKRVAFSVADVTTALFVLGRGFRMSIVGAQRYKIAEHDAFTITTRQHFKKHYPIVLTVDAPDRVLEAKLTGEGQAGWSVVRYAPGPWEAELFDAAKPFFPSLGLGATGQPMKGIEDGGE
jgi:hypothetical protein